MKRSKFNLSFTKLFTSDMGELVPIACKEVLPGDTWQHSTALLLRVSPLLSPVMHPVRVRIHHWYVPTRIIWDDFEDFITGGPDGMDASVWPTIETPSTTGFDVGSLAEYLGVPTGAATANELVSALPFRAYQLIFNEWYRDQDLVSPVSISTASGVDATTSRSLQNAAWEKDYFTSSRLDPQKGPEVTLPLGTTAPVELSSSTNPALAVAAATGNPLTDGLTDLRYGTAANNARLQGFDGTVAKIDPNGTLQTDLSAATAASVNDIRLAMALMRYEEARARYGSRYTEYLRYLGVRSSDARLQRPEYLGGGKQTIQFSEVLQTGTNFDANTGVATLRGHGIAAMRSNRYRRFFEEHGFVITLMSVIPKTIYADGLQRMWHRSTKEDYFQRELQHIGQQEVYNREVYLGHTSPSGVFGYQDRYDEYRRSESEISGEFRTILNTWHYGRLFTSDPALNSDFVTCVPTKRVNASTSTDCLWVQANHSIQARRLLAQVGKSYIY